MLIPIILVVFSLLLLTAGAEGLVRGSASIALRAGLTPLVIGLTVVAFGTSSPELVVSLKASLLGQGDLAVGNVVGSNIFNIGIILGITALVCPVPVKLQIVKIDAPVMILVAIILPLMLMGGYLGRMEGGLLFLGLLAYTVFNVRLARKETSAAIADEFSEGIPPKSKHWIWDVTFLVGGLALLVLGSNLLVDNCIIIARSLGVSEAVIGLTIVAAGTSMPELATSVIAAIRKEPDIAIGNIVGSNIFNILGILGVSALVSPITVTNIQVTDYLVMIGISLLLLPVLWSGLRVRRLEGVLLLACYFSYLYMLWPKS
ncbi:MAG: calcium/sodium antiporter [Chthoniobacterales bacterium]